MNRKLSDWASIADIVSGLAVLITLVILVFEVRDNTEIVRATAYGDRLDSFSNLQIGMLTDADAMRVWTDFMLGQTQDFDAVDRQRLTLILLTMFRTYESAYFSQQFLGTQEWERFLRAICQFYGQARDAERLGPIRATTTEEFMSYVVDTCANPSD